MNEPSLTQRVNELFQWALTRTATSPALADLHRLLTEGEARLQAPMRVAIIGRIKAGKSTAMNALLGHEVVATGEEEVTFNVTWFQWGDPPALLVHYKDGRAAESQPFSALEELTRRSHERLEQLLAIDYIVASYPNDLLRRVNLIDTPGLASYYDQDSENTRRFIQLTEQQAAKADAVLYLFDRSIADEEHKLVEEFVGPAVGQRTPLNAIGGLTMVDDYWPSEAMPMEAAERVVERLRELPPVRRTLYTIVPVCGLLALGAQTLTPAEFQTLIRLAKMPEERFARFIKTAERFATTVDTELPVAPADRQRLLARLGLYGVWFARRLIREGLADLAQLAEELLKHSGLPQLYRLILSHFGNRAFLIKLDKILRDITVLDFQLRPRVAMADQIVLQEVMTRFEALRTEQHSLKELGVLRRYYEGSLDFSQEEVDMLLQVTGENGITCDGRLGMPGATLEALLPVAQERIRYWKAVAVDWGSDTATVEAARVLAHSYERIAYRLQEANRYSAVSQRPEFLL